MYTAVNAISLRVGTRGNDTPLHVLHAKKVFDLAYELRRLFTPAKAKAIDEMKRVCTRGW